MEPKYQDISWEARKYRGLYQDISWLSDLSLPRYLPITPEF